MRPQTPNKDNLLEGLLSNDLPQKRRILFLFSDTGGGHRSAAEAIIEAIHLEFPGEIDCEMVDILKEYGPPPINLAPRIYPPLSRMPTLWGMGYKISDGTRRVRAFYSAIWPYIRRNIKRLLDDHPSDLVVSVHQLINVPVARLALPRRTPFITVVTDLVTTHAAWYATRASHVIVPTNEAYLRGLKHGLRPDQMTIIGLPVANRFCIQGAEDREAARARLGWNTGRPLILMVGGGEGMGPLESMATAIDDARLPVALAIITGRNETLRAHLQERKWHNPAFIYGFVKEMPSFMNAADILVTKAGPGTISEAFIAGLPMVMYSRLPGQEDGNVTFVNQSGAGVWAPHTDELVAILKKWLKNPAERERAARISKSLAHPEAARQIARVLVKYAKRG
jgi:1,2-diacylglycerol 3-beta-galactosyltransferase